MAEESGEAETERAEQAEAGVGSIVGAAVGEAGAGGAVQGAGQAQLAGQEREAGAGGDGHGTEQARTAEGAGDDVQEEVQEQSTDGAGEAAPGVEQALASGATVQAPQAAGAEKSSDENVNKSSFDVKLDDQISKIPGLHVSDEDRKQTIEMMKKAEQTGIPKPGTAQVYIACEVCGKKVNKKSLARHLRDVHGRKSSVSSLVCDFEAEKRKAGNSLSPPLSEPLPKDVKFSAPFATAVESGSRGSRGSSGGGSSSSPKLRRGSGSKGSQGQGQVTTVPVLKLELVGTNVV